MSGESRSDLIAMEHKVNSPSTVSIKPEALQKVAPIFHPFCAEATAAIGMP